ncbi:MAG: amidohydrolase family protein [Staphylothermus sp.]|nr:amidohydrolase family protein [Staphylothermus sp.]
MGILIRNARFIVSPLENYELSILENKNIFIENNKIECIDDNCGNKTDIVIDASNHIVIPGFINAHTHAAMVFLRGALPDAEFWEWMPRITDIEKKLITKELVFHASRLACLEMLVNGIVGFIDMYYHPFETLEACQKYGLYIASGPIYSHEKRKQIEEFYREAGRYQNHIPLVNIHSLYSQTEEDILEAHYYSLENNMRLQIHVSETRREVFLLKKKTGHWPVEYMYRKKLLDKNTILAHANWLTSTELEYVAEKGSYIVTCPHTTMRLAEAGFTPIYEALEKGVVVGIGTDGSSGDRYNVLDEIKELVLLYRHNYWDTRLKIKYVYPRLILNNYKIFRIKGGIIKPKYPAHLALLRINPIKHTPLKRDNLLARLVLSGEFRVDYTIINGIIKYDINNLEQYLDDIKTSLVYIEKISESIDYEKGAVK